MLREQHRLKNKTKEKKMSWQYQILLAVPKNLVYVFGLVILFAFFGMLYVVYTDTNLNTLIEYKGAERV